MSSGPCGKPWCCFSSQQACCGDCGQHHTYALGEDIAVMDGGEWHQGVALWDHVLEDGSRVVDAVLRKSDPVQWPYGWCVDRKYATDVRGLEEPP